MNDRELKQWIADQVKAAVTERFASEVGGFTVIDITPTELSIRVVDRTRGGIKYYRVKVTEAT